MKTTTEKVGRMHNPPHPGEVLKELWIEPLALTQAQVAEALGVSRKTVSSLLNAKIPASPDLAMRIAIAFQSDALIWIGMQAKYDAWQIESRRATLSKEVKVIHWDVAA